MKKNKPPFEEEFAGLLHDVFRASGMPLSNTSQERLQKIMPRLASAISREAHKASLDLVKRLQEATKNGFEAYEKELAKTLEFTKNLTKANNNEIKSLMEEVNELREKVEKLEKGSFK